MCEPHVVAAHRVVVLDPDGTAPRWALVVVEWPTGVRCEHQYGGTANRQGDVEGYLVPVNGTEALPILDEVFVRRVPRLRRRSHAAPTHMGECPRAPVRQLATAGRR